MAAKKSAGGPKKSPPRVAVGGEGSSEFGPVGLRQLVDFDERRAAGAGDAGDVGRLGARGRTDDWISTGEKGRSCQAGIQAKVRGGRRRSMVTPVMPRHGFVTPDCRPKGGNAREGLGAKKEGKSGAGGGFGGVRRMKQPSRRCSALRKGEGR